MTAAPAPTYEESARLAEGMAVVEDQLASTITLAAGTVDLIRDARMRAAGLRQVAEHFVALAEAERGA